MKYTRYVTLAAVLLLTCATLYAAAPKLLNYQSYITDSFGAPLDTTVDITFKIWDDSSGGTALWTEIHPTVTIAEGNIGILLGSVTPLDDQLFSDTIRYLGLTVGADPEISPRTRLVTVPYAHRISTLDGAKAGDVTGTLIITPDQAKAIGEAILIKNQNDEIVFSAKVDALGKVEVSLFDPVDSKDGRAVEPKITINKDGVVIHGASGADTSLFLKPDGNIQGKGNLTMGDSSANAGPGAVVCGGAGNVASGTGSIVGGGVINKASGLYSGILGGWHNDAMDTGTVICGGYSNEASGYYSSVMGGAENSATAYYSFVGNGLFNSASGDVSLVVGGFTNMATGAGGSIVGGFNNNVGDSGFVGGGYNNGAYTGGAVAGGGFNSAQQLSAVGGGYGNGAGAAGFYCTIAGGHNNSATLMGSTVGGGDNNLALERYATIPGGRDNSASDQYAFAAGRRAKSNHAGSFVWADSTDSDFSSSAVNEFNIRSSGGIRIFTDSGLSAGVTMGSGASAWSPVSDRNAKKDFRELNSEELLQKLSEIPISKWKYIAEESQADHIGPMAQDFYSVFGLGDDDKRISTIDADGVAMAAIQALYKQNQELKRELKEIRKQLDVLSAK